MKNVFSVFLANWETALIGGVIVVSAVIVIMGALKFLFNKIKNKYLRKFLLSFSSVLLAMPATAIYFVSSGISFDYYWIGYAMTAFATIIAYWFYENTCLRELIQKIGTLTIGRLFNAFLDKVRGKSNDVEATQTVQALLGNEKPNSISTSAKEEKEVEEINKL